jgi:membrane-bound lytic murein transglycosylase B
VGTRGRIRQGVLSTTAVVASAGLAAGATLLPTVVLGGSDDGTDAIVSLDATPDSGDDLLSRMPRRSSSRVADGIPARTTASAEAKPAVYFQPAPSPSESAQPRPATISDLSASGIPEVALKAYRAAEATLAKADPSCRLHWSLLAGIGRVESDHGRFGGAVLRTDGRPDPAIIGIPLDGRPGVARISDSDGGAFDGDTVFDRAVGPMQFIPGTWDMVGADGNGDGVEDPQNINDAALAAGVYLCSGSGDLSTQPGRESAVLRYNRSDSYVRLVLALADSYKAGLPVDRLPIGAPAGSPPDVPATPPDGAANPGPPGAVTFVDGPSTGQPTKTAKPAKPAPTTTKSPTPAPTETPKQTPTDTPTTPAPTKTPKPTTSPTETPPTETPTPTPTPEKPIGLQAVQAPGGLRLTWDNPTPDVTYVYRAHAEEVPAVEGTLSKDEPVITGLTPGKLYTVQLRAVSADGTKKSEWSNEASDVPTMPGDPTPPSPPSGLKSSDVTATTVTVSWDASKDDGGILRYNVHLVRVADGQKRVLPTDATTLAIDELTAGTDYKFWVVAVDNAFHRSTSSDAVTFKTVAAEG